MKMRFAVVIALLAFGAWSCSSTSSDKDTTGGKDTTGSDTNLDTNPADTGDQPTDVAEDDTVADVGEVSEDLSPEDTLLPEDTLPEYVPQDTPGIDVVYGPASSCKSESEGVVFSCDYYWAENTNVAAMQSLCESMSQTWSLGNSCATGAIGYCQDTDNAKTSYCYPVNGMSNTDKIDLCKLGCPEGAFVTI